MSENLTSRAFHGLKWTYGSTAVTSVLQIGLSAIMARLLAPEAFGLVAIAGVMLSFGIHFAQMGIGAAVVQKKVLLRKEIHAAFLLSSGLGLLFFVIGVLLVAPAAKLIFNQPDVVPVVRVLALSFLLTGISATALKLLQRQLNFRTLAILDLSSYVIGYGFIGIGLAYSNFGVWSLVVASLSQSAVSMIGAHVLVRHGLSMVWRKEDYRYFFSFGSRVSVVGFLEFIGNKLDTFFIGRFLGAGPMGIYDRAYMLAYAPNKLQSGLSSILLPSFSRMQNNVPRLKRTYLSAVMLAGAVVMPTCVGLSVAGKEAVLVMLGDQWTEAVPVLQVLALAIAVKFLTGFGAVACEATATLNAKIIIQLVFITVFAGFIYLFRTHGLTGFALALLCAQTVRHLCYVRVMKNLLRISFSEMSRVYVPGLLNAVVIGGALYFVSSALEAGKVSVFLAFGIEAGMGLLLLIILTILGPFSSVQRLVRKLIKRIDTKLSNRILRFLNAFDRSVSEV